MRIFRSSTVVKRQPETHEQMETLRCNKKSFGKSVSGFGRFFLWVPFYLANQVLYIDSQFW